MPVMTQQVPALEPETEQIVHLVQRKDGQTIEWMIGHAWPTATPDRKAEALKVMRIDEILPSEGEVDEETGEKIPDQQHQFRIIGAPISDESQYAINKKMLVAFVDYSTVLWSATIMNQDDVLELIYDTVRSQQEVPNTPTKEASPAPAE